MSDDAFSNIVDLAAQDNLVGIADKFASVMLAKVQDEVEKQKVEVAKQMFATPFEVDDNEAQAPEEGEEEGNEEESDETDETQDDVSDEELDAVLDDLEDENEEEQNG